jgi:hypothetical protein
MKQSIRFNVRVVVYAVNVPAAPLYVSMKMKMKTEINSSISLE